MEMESTFKTLPLHLAEAKLIRTTAFFALIMASAGSLKAQTLIAHFSLDTDGNSSVGRFTASTVSDAEFGSDGANGAMGTSATFNGASSIIQHDWSTDRVGPWC